jgi:hypothetical protein
MIIGAHSIVYSKDSTADRGFFQDVLGLSHVDVGGGWLIFALPPAEVAVHPAKKPSQGLYLMTDDVAAFVASMEEHGIDCTPPADQGWRMLTTLTLPGGGELGVYEPRHARPEHSAPPKARGQSKGKAKAPSAAKSSAAKSAKSARKKAAKSAPKKKAAKAAPGRKGAKKR